MVWVRAVRPTAYDVQAVLLWHCFFVLEAEWYWASAFFLLDAAGRLGRRWGMLKNFLRECNRRAKLALRGTILVTERREAVVVRIGDTFHTNPVNAPRVRAAFPYSKVYEDMNCPLGAVRRRWFFRRYV